MKCVSRALFALLAFTVASAADQAPFLLQPGVLVNPATDTLYLIRPEGALEARIAATGKQLWLSDKAIQPLNLSGSELIAATAGPQSTGVAIVALNAEGEEQWRAPLPLPEDAWASIDEGPGKSLRISSAALGDELVVWWHSLDKDISGMARPQNPSEKQGSLAWRPQARVFESRSGLPPQPEPPNLRLLPQEARLNQVNGVQWLAANGQHILVSERVGDDRIWEKYRWTIFEKASGKRLGQVSDHFSTAPFHVSGNTLVFVAQPYLRRNGDQMERQPLRLQAVDLTNGRLLWRQEIRDTRYHGSMPP